MPKVLIADDEPRMRKLVSDFLTRDGFTVLEARDGVVNHEDGVEFWFTIKKT